jgi:hypothetical protein
MENRERHRKLFHYFFFYIKENEIVSEMIYIKNSLKKEKKNL